METKGTPVTITKKTSMTPKAIIYQKFGDKACYKVEEVQDTVQNGCPGLNIPQKGPCLFRCTLQLPDIVVVSDTFRRKKDAEQSAAEKAIEKLGIHQKEYNPTVQEAWDDLAGRLAFLFSNEFLSSIHPLSGHIRASLRRKGHFEGQVPISAIAAYDAKISNICKYVDSKAESRPLLFISLVLKAAAKLTDLIMVCNEKLSLQRITPYPSEVIPSSTNHESNSPETVVIEAVRIPASPEKAVESLTLKISPNNYHLDVIAQELGSTDASDVLISRTIGKASSEMRIYFSASKQHLLHHLSEPPVKREGHSEGSFNSRASYFSGQDMYGDAILASVGYAWKSTDLSHDNISLRTYYRILLNMVPDGAYKISREAILAGKLPLAFTTKSNWRGSFPRDILCTFCRCHHLSEPVFSTPSMSLDSSPDPPGLRKKLKVMEAGKEENGLVDTTSACGDPNGCDSEYTCEVKIYTKHQDLILQCSPKESYKKQIDAIQCASLKVLSWLSIFFERPGMSMEKLNCIADELDIHFTPPNLVKAFALCHSVHKLGIPTTGGATGACGPAIYNNAVENEESIDTGIQNSAITPSNGSLASISYSVSLCTQGDGIKEYLESCEEFEFEIGNEAVLPQLEAAVTQMTVGQSVIFQMELPSHEFILAAAGDSAATLSLLSSGSCKLEYSITLLRVMEPLEERMEQALFSPPLSKQRVEFAVQHIKESSASSLVDFGCGSGSLLDSLLQYSTSLEKIVGVDISQRSLARAAKSVNTKLNKLVETKESCSEIKSAVLYYGSITELDSRLCGSDIATCLEVIEHMEEEDACLFGDVVLSSFCPRILIVSTPNYEYNVILQRSTPQNQDEDPDEKNQSQSCKFRNHDHKFEWTRAQFELWATDLAAKHNYSVEFSGVGGTAGVEPGFASQIAIFRRRDVCPTNIEVAHPYLPIWEWSKEDLALALKET